MTNTSSATATTLPAPTPDRRALLGGAGSLAMAAMGVASTTPAAADDAEAQLLAGLDVLEALSQAWANEIDPCNALQAAYEKGRPPRPLEQRCRFMVGFSHGTAFYVEPDGKQYAFIPDAEIEQLRANPQPATFITINDYDEEVSDEECPRVINHGGYEQPLSERGKQHWAEQDAIGRAAAARVVAAYDAWRAECDAYADRIGLTAAQQAHDAAKDAFHDEVARLRALPATTLRGFACKARILTWFDDDEGMNVDLLVVLAEYAPVPVPDQDGA